MDASTRSASQRRCASSEVGSRDGAFNDFASFISIITPTEHAKGGCSDHADVPFSACSCEGMEGRTPKLQDLPLSHHSPHPSRKPQPSIVWIPSTLRHQLQSLFEMTAQVPCDDSEIPVPDKVLRDLAKNVAKILPNFDEEEPATGVK